MSDIRFEGWLHRSGTGGVYQDSAGNVGIASTQPKTRLDIGNGAFQVGPTGICTATLVNATPLSHRNKVINGAMNVAQRGTSQTGTNSSGYKTVCDRWRLNANGSNVGTYRVFRSSDIPGEFAFSYKFDCTTARSSLASNELLDFEQRIEGRNLQRFAKGTASAKQFALSFSVNGFSCRIWIFSQANNISVRRFSRRN